MAKLNKFIKENIMSILIVFLVSQPILDVLTSICINYLNINFTIGMVARFLFLGFITYYIFFIKYKDILIKRKLKRYLIALYLFIAIIGLYYTFININLAIYEVKNLFKIFYFSTIICFLILIKEDLKKIDLKSFNIIFITYISFIFIPNLFGGLNSYDYAKLGSKGLFNSANEISAIISLLFPVFLYNMLNSKNKRFYFIPIIIYIYVILSIGTKVPVFAFIITMFIFVLYFFINIIKSKKKNMIILSLASVLFLITSFVLIVPKTSFYKNIKIHMNYFEIDSITDVFTKYENINHIIFSERLSLFKNNIKIYKNANFENKLIGIGYYFFDNTSKYVEERKIVEIDYFDIFISYGIVGFIIWLAPLIYLLYLYLKNKNNFKNKRPLYTALYSLIFLISFFSGHVFTAPAVSIFVALFLVMPIIKVKEG